MVEYQDAVKILSEMVQIGRTFRMSSQRNAEHSFTGTKFGLLQQLRHNEARLGELARGLNISAPVASRAIDSLEGEKLVERRTDSQDARALTISITEQGRAKLAESESRSVQQFAEALSDWTSEDAEQAVHILHRLQGHLAKITSPETFVQPQTKPTPQQ